MDIEIQVRVGDISVDNTGHSSWSPDTYQECAIISHSTTKPPVGWMIREAIFYIKRAIIKHRELKK